MSDEKATSGATTDTGGSENQNKDSGNLADAYQKLLKEKKNWVDKAKSLESQISDLKSKWESKENETLEKQLEYKTLYEKLKAENDEVRKQISLRDEREIQNRKLSAVEKKFFELGLRPDYKDKALSLADLAQVSIDPDTGVAIGADDVVKKIYQDFKDVLFVKRPVGASHAASTMNSAISGRPDFSKMKTAGEAMDFIKKNLAPKKQ